jgi:glycosyltransferase involved in cell wall biosynthesis
MKARVIICVSDETRRQAKRLTGLKDDRFAVVPNALNYPYRPMPGPEASAHLGSLGLDSRRPYFLHVGGNQWYKNRNGVVRLFAELVRHSAFRDHCLVMAGKPWTKELRQAVQLTGLGNRIIERVDLHGEQLRALYSRAEVLLFPSLSEGFGWPIVEAQACGCPVATTNRPPMTEVGGDAALYIEPDNPVDAAQRIAAMFTNRERWQEAGIKNAGRFSSRAMIAGYTRCYQAVSEATRQRTQAEWGGRRS